MAGITLSNRDLVETRARLSEWFATRIGEPVTLSDLDTANHASGWSSESLRFTATRTDGSTSEHVVRIPPSGGGIFAEYDLDGQTRTQNLLRDHGIPTPSPILYEPDDGWIGSRFLVMPRIVGHIPADLTYATKGWLHDAHPRIQRNAHDAFLGTLVALHRVPRTEAPWLIRATGTGIAAELKWWRDYAHWGTDGRVPDVMTDAFDWLVRHQPEDTDDLVLCWGDARFSNAIFDDEGALVGALDWEQACWCSPEYDFAWWLATRRQMLDVHGLDLDPELPGFDGRARVVERFEEMIGRPLADLHWYEIFAMVRMGCCIVRMQALLRSIGRTDHGFTRAPILPSWTVEAIR